MKPKILIVDDSKTSRLALVGPLQAFACELLQAADGFEGLALARRHKPALILLDVTMPKLDGTGMLAQLRTRPDTRSIPVIMITGQQQRDAVMPILRLGVSDYLIKPVADQDLLDRVGRILKLAPASLPAPVRRIEDPLTLLLVEDKPAISDQLREHAGTIGWQLECRTTVDEAMEFCAGLGETRLDAVLVSLSLALDGAFGFREQLRQHATLSAVPVIGICPKPEVDLQNRARQQGFAGVITKPINFSEFRPTIATVLGLDASSSFFERIEGALVVHWPATLASSETANLMRLLPGNLSQAIDEGIDKLVIDLAAVCRAHPGLIRFLTSVVDLCGELGLHQRIAAAEDLMKECRQYDEGRRWEFSGSVDEALNSLNSTATPAA